MFKRVIVVFFFFGLVTSVSIQAQDKDILCQVLDKSTQQPIVFATVSIKDRNNGVIADEDGYFRLPYTYKQQKDVLIISSIGYESKILEVTSLLDGEINIIKLKPKLEALNAITIVTNKRSRKKNFIPARKIVAKAISNMRLNYPTNSHSYIAYYRDYQLLDKSYVNLNEGILEVFDAGFQTSKIFDSSNQTALYSYASNIDFPQDSVLSMSYNQKSSKYIKDATISPLGGNELSILNVHNPIRNNANNSFSFVYRFKDDFLYNHKFRIIRKMYLDDIPIYEIKFSAIDEIAGVKNSAEGTIYIAYDSFAIHKFEYNAFGLSKKDPLYSVRLEYVSKRNKMYLNYISFNNRFQVKNVHSFKIEDVSFDASENAFYVRFNNEINQNSELNPKDFRFIFRKRKLKISDVVLTDAKTVKIALIQGAIPENVNIDDRFIKDLKYKIKNIKDVASRPLGRVSELEVNQFRELFIQEVFENKPLPNNLRFVNKKTNLKKSVINKSEDISTYWLNIPLKTTKN
ncbi:hypothetical protein A9Q87_07060 [Flavobacteriales bacterium 34_180_T64]|nr:hypothetical protein A9Q87_07060 [Flavobacteriales bacterium 34_180_T64]